MAALELFETNLFNDANLVSYWRMEGNSTDSKDSNNGTDTSVTYSTGNGKFGQGGGYASASNSKTVIAEAANLKITSNFSVLIWFKNNTSAQTQILFQSYSEAGSQNAGIVIYQETDNKLHFRSAKNTGNLPGTDFAEAVSASTINDNAWHMAFSIWDGSNLNLYIDNSAVVQTAWANAAAYQSPSYPRIGCFNSTGSDILSYNGALDDIAIFNRALSSTEVSDHWSGADIFVPSPNVFDSVTTSENLSETGTLNVNLARSGVRII